MKNERSKILTLFLACALVVSIFVACNRKEDNTVGLTANTAEAEPSPDARKELTVDTAASEAGLKGFEPFADQVTITVPVYDRSKEGYPPVDDNYWTRWVQTEFGDKYNITVEYIAIPRNDVMTKYNMLINTGNTPTILMEYDYPKVAGWANDDVLTTIDLNAFAHIAPDYYRMMVDNQLLQYSKLNGRTYFVLSERPYYNTNYTYATFIRKDWLDAVGKAIPRNYGEYCEAIDAIMAAGLTDQAPVDISLPANAYVENFGFRDYPVKESEWIMHSSVGTASLTWEPTYRLLKRQNAEYNKGYINKDYDLDADGSQAKEDFIRGKTFSYGGYLSANVDWLTEFYKNNPDAELAIADINEGYEEGVKETPSYRTNNPFGMVVGFSASATAEQLQAAWMYMEWMCQPETLFTLENGIKGVTYDTGADGLPVVIADYTGEGRLNHNCNIDMTCIVHAGKVNGTIEQSIAAITPQGLPQDFYQPLVQHYYSMVEASRYAYSDPIFTESLKAESKYSDLLFHLYQEYSVQLTKCDPAEFDSLYTELCRKYQDSGYQEIIDERLASYNEGKTTKLPEGFGW